MKISKVELKVLSLGEWLNNKNYTGIDVSVKNPPKEISSTLAFSCMGWINLFLKYKEKNYFDKAEICLDRILKLKNNEELWLFPYNFRDNPPNFPYACENFMTLKALLYFIDKIQYRKNIAKSIYFSLKSLEEHIGYTKDGCFFYSPADKIEVPNISSMAANIYAGSYLIFNDASYLEKADSFADYCIRNQRDDGGYNYFSDKTMVYIPYHALEIFELIETNKILKSLRLENSIKKAIAFMKSHFNKKNYLSYDCSIDSIVGRSTILFKTPLWMARAFLMSGDNSLALKHYENAITLFNSYNKNPYYFYCLKILNIGSIKLRRPLGSTLFIRYNASCFEIGSRLLLEINDNLI